MPDIYYPPVDITFIVDSIKASGKLADEGIIKVGSTTIIVIQGTQASYKRTTLIRELTTGHICLEQATYLAFKFSFLGQLRQWLIDNRNWKDGAYIVS